MTLSSYSKIIGVVIGLCFLFTSSSTSAQYLVLTGPIKVKLNAGSAKSKMNKQVIFKFALLPDDGQDPTNYFADYNFYKSEINKVFIRPTAQKLNDFRINRKQKKIDLFCFGKANLRMELFGVSTTN